MRKYRILKISDAKEVAIIHEKAFEGFFLTTLGRPFLETYYKSCIKYINALAICAVDEKGSILGFIVGSLNSKGFHKRLILNNIYSYAIQLIIISFTKPKSLLRLYRNLNKEASPEDCGDYAEVLSIGVLVEKKGLGIGKGLLFEFEKIINTENIKRVSLTTDLNSNEGVLKFYKSMGYGVYYEFTTYPDRQMFKLIKKI